MLRRKLLLIGLVVVHLWLLANLRFTAWPEMVSYPYLFNHGFELYSDFIYPYSPLLTWMLATGYEIFGYKLLVMKIFVWALILVNDWLIYLIIRKITQSQWMAMTGVGMYVFLQPFFEGNMVWFDVVVATPILVGLYFLIPKRNYLGAGMALGAACLVKQTAVIFVVLGVGYGLYIEAERRKISRLLIGPVVMGFGLAGWVWCQGGLENMLKWTLVYPLTEWGKYPGYVEMSVTADQLKALILLAVPVIILMRRKKQNEKGLLMVFLAGALIMVYPRFSYFHLQTALAVMAIIWVIAVNQKSGVMNYGLVGIMILGMWLGNHRQVVAREWGGEARFWGREDREKAEVINGVITEGERVFLLGEQSGLYAMAGRLPPKPWTDNFGWYLEIEGVQEEMIRGWEENPGEAVIWKEPQGSEFSLGGYQPEKVTKWIGENYNREEEIWEGTWLWRKKG